MDNTEDVSARFILGQILSTELPRTPMIRSDTQAQSTSGIRRSSRLSGKDAVAQTPKDLVRSSMKQRIRQSITQKSQPAPRRTTSFVLKKTRSSTSQLFDDGETPRHILRNILQTEQAKPPVVHEKTQSDELEPLSAVSSSTKSRPSVELSELDLPDLTVGNIASTVKGMSRKRPRRSLNVTAFEKRLRGADEAEERSEESSSDISSLSLSSSASLSLKTPFVDVRTEKKGLQRKVSNRRKITEEEFGAAVSQRQITGETGFPLAKQGLGESTHFEGFTLGLSKLGEPDLTTDILHCNTALYPQPEAMTSNISIMATQDKPTVAASQIQRDLEEQEEQMKLETGSSFPTEDGVMAEMENIEHSFKSQPREEEETDQSQEEEHERDFELHVNIDGGMEAEAHAVTEESEDGQSNLESQTEEEVVTLKEKGLSKSEEDEIVSDSNPKDDESNATDSRKDTESQEDSEAAYYPEEEVPESEYQLFTLGATEIVEATESEEEEKDAVSQTSQEHSPTSHSEQDDEAQSQSVAESPTNDEESVAQLECPSEDGPTGSQSHVTTETGSQSEEIEDMVESGSNMDNDGRSEEQKSEQPSSNVEHISRRSHRSEGGPVLYLEQEQDLDNVGEGFLEVIPEANINKGLEAILEPGEDGNIDEFPTLEQRGTSVAGEEAGADDHIHHETSPEEEGAASRSVSEQEEEVSDDEENDFPSKTPAFVKAKRNFYFPDPSESPTVLKNDKPSDATQAVPVPKPKPVRQRKKRSTEKKVLPKSYLMSVFRHFAKTKVASDVYPVLNDIMDKFFSRLADDLETYAAHAKRKTIEVEDVVLLLKRQGYVNDKVPVEVLIEKYLRMDQRRLLIPIATSGNVVIPKLRK